MFGPKSPILVGVSTQQPPGLMQGAYGRLWAASYLLNSILKQPLGRNQLRSCPALLCQGTGTGAQVGGEQKGATGASFG